MFHRSQLYQGRFPLPTLSQVCQFGAINALYLNLLYVAPLDVKMNSEVRPVLLSFDSMGVATLLREHILSS